MEVASKPIDPWPDRVRNRPGMWIGSTTGYGLATLVYELVGNAIDQFTIGAVGQIEVKIDRDTVIVSDDGPGLPFDRPALGAASSLAEQLLTTPHDERSVDNHAPHIHLMQIGTGLATVCALAASLLVESFRNGSLWRQQFSRGLRVAAAEIAKDTHGRGTMLRLEIDRDLFPTAVLPRSSIRASLFEAVHLFPGLTICFDSERFLATSGLDDYADCVAGRLPYAHRSLSVDEVAGDVRVMVAARSTHRHTGSPAPTRAVMSWANGARTIEGGSHVDGLLDGVTAMGWEPDLALVHVVMMSPEYAGPTRGRLSAPHVRPVVAELVRDGLARVAARETSDGVDNDRSR